MEGNVYRVVEFQHVKPGKGAAFVRTKLKNVITGAVILVAMKKWCSMRMRTYRMEVRWNR